MEFIIVEKKHLENTKWGKMTKEAEWVLVCSSIKEYIVYNADNTFGSSSILSAIKVGTILFEIIYVFVLIIH